MECHYMQRHQHCYNLTSYLLYYQLQEPKVEPPTATEEESKEHDVDEKDDDAEVDEQIAGLQVKTFGV